MIRLREHFDGVPCLLISSLVCDDFIDSVFKFLDDFAALIFIFGVLNLSAYFCSSIDAELFFFINLKVGVFEILLRLFGEFALKLLMQEFLCTSSLFSSK